MLYANYNTKTQQTPRARWSERPKPKPSENQNQKPWAISQVKPSEANWSQVKPKPKAKTKSQVGTQMGDLAPKCMQNADFSSRMQQIARTASPGFRMKNKKNKYHP